MGQEKHPRAKRLAALLVQRRLASINPATGKPYTTYELAKITGKSRKTISALENGLIQTVDPDTVRKLTAVLPVTEEELLRAMGYEVAGLDITEDEAALLGLYRRMPEHGRVIIRAAMRSEALWQDKRGQH